jgi:glycosyltransferase involved in cell wall biosynthesis
MKLPNRKLCIYSPWMTAVGGIETHLLNVSKTVAGHGWEVDFCVKYSELPPEVIAGLAEAGVRYHTFPQPSFFAAVINRRSVLYTNSQGNTSPLIWCVAGRHRKGFHHCHTACSAAEMQSWVPRYKKFIGAGPPLVACSEATKANILAWSPNRQVTVMPYLTTIAGDPAGVERRVTRVRAEKRPGKLNFGFVGRLDPSKGIDVIIEASRCEACRDVDWHFFGNGPESERIRGAEADNLFWHGAFDRSTPLEAIYGGLDAVVLPSLHTEGSPLCLIEALSFGKPWIASNQGGISELICSAEDHLTIDPRNKQLFVDAVVSLKGQLLAGAVQHEAIRAFYQANYSPEAVTARWMKLLEDLLLESTRESTSLEGLTSDR